MYQQERQDVEHLDPLFQRDVELLLLTGGPGLLSEPLLRGLP